jgi:hypothetical protein
MASTKQTEHNNPDLTRRTALTKPSGALLFLCEQKRPLRKAAATKSVRR